MYQTYIESFVLGIDIEEITILVHIQIRLMLIYWKTKSYCKYDHMLNVKRYKVWFFTWVDGFDSDLETHRCYKYVSDVNVLKVFFVVLLSKQSISSC